MVRAGRDAGGLDLRRDLRGLRSRSVLAPPRWSLALPAGLLLVAAVSVADSLITAHVVLGTGLSVVTLLVALVGRRGDTLVVALAGDIAAIASGSWNGWGSAPYGISLAIVLSLSVVAVLVALLRAEAAATGRQLRVLHELLAMADASVSPEEMVTRLEGVIVPELADRCSIELSRAAAEDELGRAPRLLLGADCPPGASSAMVLPLRARGSAFGRLLLGMGPSRRRYRGRDLGFGELVAGRVAVALDNAGLTLQVAATERRLGTALESLGAAVTMNAPDGRTVYANRAAVELLGAATASELYDLAPGEISRRFAIYDEGGAPVGIERLPAFRALAGEDEPEPLLVRNVVRATGEERWLLNRVSVLRGPDGAIENVVNVIEDLTGVKRAELSQRLLSEATRALSSSLDYAETLQRVAEIAVPELADWCGVDLPGDDGTIVPVAIAHGDPSKVALGRELRERYPVRMNGAPGLPRVLAEGVTEELGPVADEEMVAYAADEEHLRLMRAVGFGRILVVPLVAGGRTLGAITLVREDPVRRFTDADRRLAEELGQRAGIAVLNARLYTERSRIAAELQHGLLPPPLPEVAGMSTAALYRPAGELDEVGGDFYDAFATPRGWMLVIGDVAGQGARAAALTGLARFTLRCAGQLTGDPLAAVGMANDALIAQREMSLCTIACLLFHEQDGSLAVSVVSAGHPEPLLVRDGAAAAVGDHGPLAGAFADASWPLDTIPLQTGDALVLYTDGVIDTVGAVDRFGERRLAAVLGQSPRGAQALVDAVDAALRSFQSSPHGDDTAVVALEVGDAEAALRAVAAARETRA